MSKHTSAKPKTIIDRSAPTAAQKRANAWFWAIAIFGLFAALWAISMIGAHG
jgi:hypothetical protein